VLRAVETRRPVLRCGNGGWSGWIDEFGGLRATATNDDDSIYFRGTRRSMSRATRGGSGATASTSSTATGLFLSVPGWP